MAIKMVDTPSWNRTDHIRWVHTQNRSVLNHHLRAGGTYTVEHYCPVLSETFRSLYPEDTKFSEHVLVFPCFNNSAGIMSTVLVTSLTETPKKRRICGGAVEPHEYFDGGRNLVTCITSETPSMAAKRELLQETGLNGQSFQHVHTDVSYRPSASEVHLKHVLVCWVSDLSTMKTYTTEPDGEQLYICAFPCVDVMHAVRRRTPLLEETLDHDYHACQALSQHSRHFKAIDEFIHQRMAA